MEGKSLHQLLRFKEALQVPHLPDSHQDEYDGLAQRPPQNSCVGAVAYMTKSLLSYLWRKETIQVTSTHTKTLFTQLVDRPVLSLSVQPGLTVGESVAATLSTFPWPLSGRSPLCGPQSRYPGGHAVSKTTVI